MKYGLPLATCRRCEGSRRDPRRDARGQSSSRRCRRCAARPRRATAPSARTVTVTSDAVAAGNSARVASLKYAADTVLSGHDLEMQIAVHQDDAAVVRIAIAVRHGGVVGGGRGSGWRLRRQRWRCVGTAAAGCGKTRARNHARACSAPPPFRAFAALPGQSFAPERVNRIETRGAARRIEPEKDADGGRDAERQRHRRRRDRRRPLEHHSVTTAAAAKPKAMPTRPPAAAERDRLHRGTAAASRLAGADGPPQADLARSLAHRHEHDVH